MITTDKGIRYQQNLTGRKLALLVINTNDWTRIRRFKEIGDVRNLFNATRSLR